VLRERPEKWDWGVSPPAHQARLEVLTEALRHLARKGLTAAAVIANFHRQRVINLTERSLPIFGLTPGVPSLGSRTWMVLLPRGIAARRARNAVAEFPDNTNDLWEIKMHPGVPFSGESRFRSIADLCYSFPRSLTLICLLFAVGEPQVPPLEASDPRGTQS